MVAGAIIQVKNSISESARFRCCNCSKSYNESSDDPLNSPQTEKSHRIKYRNWVMFEQRPQTPPLSTWSKFLPPFSIRCAGVATLTVCGSLLSSTFSGYQLCPFTAQWVTWWPELTFLDIHFGEKSLFRLIPVNYQLVVGRILKSKMNFDLFHANLDFGRK